ncbi:hypothetical protein GBF38_015512, partial [Nibea albiflora]
MLSAALLCARNCRAELWNRCCLLLLPPDEPTGNGNVSCCNSDILKNMPSRANTKDALI